MNEDTTLAVSSFGCLILIGGGSLDVVFGVAPRSLALSIAAVGYSLMVGWPILRAARWLSRRARGGG